MTNKPKPKYETQKLIPGTLMTIHKIAAETGETMMEVVKRLAEKELSKIRKAEKK